MIGSLILAILAASAAAPKPSPPMEWNWIIDGTTANFEKLVMDSPKPVFVVFYTRESCDPCVTHEDALKKIMPEYSGRVMFIRVDAVKEPEIAKTARIHGVTTSFLLRPREGKGAVAEGRLDAPQLRKFINDSLAVTAKKSPSGNEVISRASDRAKTVDWPAIPNRLPGATPEIVPLRGRS